MSAATSDAILDRMMALHPKLIDLTLDRVWTLLHALGDPQDKLPPVVHIAGTNGKGSTLAMLRAGIEGAGLSAHAYTSPHLVRFHERVRLAGALISEAALTEVLDRCYDANAGASITYFEITTCAALLAFAEAEADYTLLEVGLGGRLDATNVIAPKLTVITPVSYDHQQFLGETLPEIASEKAGILKRGVPSVVARQDEAALEVIERQAARVGAPLLIHGQHWQVWEERGRLIFQDETGLVDLPLPALVGPHQIENAGSAIAGLRALGFGEEVCAAAMTDAVWPARMQKLRKGPLIEAAPQAEFILDGGHNPAAGDVIVRTLAKMSARPLHLIVGMLNTKDVTGYLEAFAGKAASLHGISIPGVQATLTAEETVAAAEAVGIRAKPAVDTITAVQEIVAEDPHARILICGSLYYAGVILAENG
ncbi:MAG: folylpolyglutamate synthase/dihydrofolate synthase family protein [Pseudomonadota bacterium]